MCFSAEASFVGGAVLSAAGVVSMRRVSRPAQRLFAAIPLFFAFQQLAEGVLWTTLRPGGNERLQSAAAHVFLITALVIWPVMIPLSMYLLEEVKKRKRVLAGLMAAGAVLALFYAYCLIFYNVTPRINGFHIQYVDNFPRTFVELAFLLYLAATIAPLFVSSVRRMRAFGVLIAVSCLVTGVFFAQYLTSVWCFFAALLSVTVCWILSEPRTRAVPVPVEVRG